MIDNKWVLPKNLHDCFFELIYLKKLTFVWIFILKNLHLCLLDFQKQSILVFCARVLLPKRFWAYFWLVKDEWISFGVSQKNGMGYVHSYFLTWKILDCNPYKYSRHVRNRLYPLQRIHLCICIHLLNIKNRLRCFQLQHFQLYCCTFLVVAGSISLRGMVLCLTPIFLCGRKVRCVPSNAS